MMLRCLLLSGLLLAGDGLAAAPLKLEALKAGSKIYRNVTIMGANATDLYFSCEEGIKNVKLKYVDAAMQKRFNYDPQTAREAERQQAEEDALYHAAIASNILAKVEQAA